MLFIKPVNFFEYSYSNFVQAVIRQRTLKKESFPTSKPFFCPTQKTNKLLFANNLTDRETFEALVVLS